MRTPRHNWDVIALIVGVASGFVAAMLLLAATLMWWLFGQWLLVGEAYALWVFALCVYAICVGYVAARMTWCKR